MDDLETAKRAAGEAAARLVEDGMTLGLGSGTTARWFIEAVGARLAEGLRVSAVATSLASAALAAGRGIPLLELDARGVDLAVDGADTVDPDLRLLKGLGGALVRERIVAAAARRFVVVADESKLRAHLAGYVPVEVLMFGWHHTMTLLDQTGAPFELRLDAAGEPLRSDNGNLIADGEFAPIADPEGLAARLDAIPGVVGHGLFLGMAALVIVAAADGSLTQLEPARGASAALS
jgi:ribose 5-phosphate isomerase A